MLFGGQRAGVNPLGNPAAPALHPRRAAVNPPAGAGGEGGPLASLLRWGFYLVTFPVYWPARLVLNVVWGLASYIGIAGPRGPTPRITSHLTPIQEVRSFTDDFRRTFGGEGLGFHDGTYSQAHSLS